MFDSYEQVCGKIMDLPGAQMPGASEITKRIVFGPEKDWPDYVMRCFTLEGSAAVPLHTHDWPHYVVIVQGRGELHLKGRKHELESMSWAYVPPHSEHSFVKMSQEPFVFLCIVPKHGDVPPGTTS
ncbi:MAG: cupin domain-containing protein [Desulfovermiculus sp.]|nr:cupin domain-containing protein [Desulfovermiculus sp.]